MSTPILRSDRFTELQKQQVIYSDITDNFDVHPDTGDLFRITNENSIKRALKHIVLTNKYERFYQPNFGIGITRFLFENITTESLHMMEAIIKNNIENYEPRVNLLEVILRDDPDTNRLNISIAYNIANITQPQLLNLQISRNR